MRIAPILLVVILGSTGCDATRNADGGASAPRRPALDADDVQQIAEAVLAEVLDPSAFVGQPKLPLSFEGYVGGLPDTVAGKPVVAVDDVDAFLNRHCAADDVELNNVLQLRLLEEKDPDLRLSAFQSCGWGGRTRAELWMTRADGSWKVKSILWRQRCL